MEPEQESGSKIAPTGRDGWFDGQGIDLHRSSFLEHHAGWRRYIADGQISVGEIIEQEQRIIELLTKLESKLDDSLHRQVTEILLEYEVLVNMALVHVPCAQAYRPMEKK